MWIFLWLLDRFLPDVPRAPLWWSSFGVEADYFVIKTDEMGLTFGDNDGIKATIMVAGTSIGILPNLP